MPALCEPDHGLHWYLSHNGHEAALGRLAVAGEVDAQLVRVVALAAQVDGQVALARGTVPRQPGESEFQEAGWCQIAFVLFLSSLRTTHEHTQTQRY